MSKFLRLFLLAVLLAGCATAYQRDGITGGYTETQLGENTFQVSFSGNGYTRTERASDFALLRSAEVAAEHGFRYFIVVGSAKDSSMSTYTTPTQSFTTGSAYGNRNSVYGSARTTTYGGETYIIEKPSATNTIVCFKERPDGTGLIFDAEFIKKSLKEKYRIAN